MNTDDKALLNKWRASYPGINLKTAKALEKTDRQFRHLAKQKT